MRNYTHDGKQRHQVEGMKRNLRKVMIIITEVCDNQQLKLGVEQWKQNSIKLNHETWKC